MISLIRNAKRDHYITLIDTCKTDWYVNELNPKSPAPSSPKLLINNNTILTDKLDIAMSLNECFSNIVSIYLPQANITVLVLKTQK